MEEVDKAFREAVADGRIHGAVLLAKDLTGQLVGANTDPSPYMKYQI